MVLDVDSLKAAAKVIVSPKKTKDNDDQLWMHDHGYIINKNSGMDVRGGILESDKEMIQYRRKMLEDAHNQRWYYRGDGIIYPQVNPNLVVDIRGNWNKPGSPVLLYERKYSDNMNQLWDLVPEDGSDVHDPSKNTSQEEDSEEYAFSSASYAL